MYIYIYIPNQYLYIYIYIYIHIHTYNLANQTQQASEPSATFATVPGQTYAQST